MVQLEVFEHPVVAVVHQEVLLKKIDFPTKSTSTPKLSTKQILQNQQLPKYQFPQAMLLLNK